MRREHKFVNGVCQACGCTQGAVQSFQWTCRGLEDAQRELERLRRIPTSSTDSIRGYRVLQQVRVVHVEHGDADEAELEFLRQVEATGASGVINMSVERDWGRISIQGDAVLVE